ncbi:hypothetical protein E1202_16875 [Saccharopolyspora karakumensis]|uniref:Uncharacterized protein n=2 Tax=Saccharopolyspora karakumensis TaxID=2530386 RepID=A0A4R5BPW1_9PSEU|nr:hypothetical protein [Saccharopolyspora karakumensis]TDD87250.1 hypothetical protein E1202_16875 [Saccharopolyspora karakumensis]
MEMLVLMFVCGLAVATLVFWPLLHRAHRKATESQQAAPHGKHALRATSAPEETATTPAASGSDEKTDREGDGEATQPVKIEATAPKPREPEPMEMPELPTDIFDARYRARFNRSQRRLERIRAEINNAG